MQELEPGMLAAPHIRLERKIAEGGMGSVWVAEHLSLKTRVAVKLILSELGGSKEVLERFEREAQAVATLRNPHVAQVFDHGVSTTGQPYIVMELLEGEDLGARIQREGRLSLPFVALVVGQAAKAIGKAHQLGIVHRDLKPENLFLTDADGDVFVKVLDFGIAKRMEKAKRVTTTGSILGTPVYMSPEQMTNSKAVGPASDVWALGVVTYHALTGEVPFDGETMAALAIAVDRGHYEPATRRVPSLPPAIDGFIARALAREPEDRFRSVKEMAESLTRIANGESELDGPSSVLPSSRADAYEARTIAPGPSTRNARPHASRAGAPGRAPRSRAVLLLGLVAIALVGVAAAGLHFVGRDVEERGVVATSTPSPRGLDVPSATNRGPTVEPAPLPTSVASTETTETSAPTTASAAPPSGSPSANASEAPRPKGPPHGPAAAPPPSAKPSDAIPTTF